MSDTPNDRTERVRALLEPPLPQAPADLIALLSQAISELSATLDEAMAQASLQGLSSRSIADAAGLAPNSVPPRLARSAALADYAEDGRVTAEGVAAARYAARAQSPRFTFTPRRPTRRDESRNP